MKLLWLALRGHPYIINELSFVRSQAGGEG
jgi:hypothetical protein